MSVSNAYPVVIYLNQKYVFDILATMEGGFSQLETVKTMHSEQEDKTRRYSGDIGVKNVFSFLGISFGAERTNKGQTGQSHESTAEKVYTPNSLFSRMRDILHAQSKIKSTLSSAASGDFVEVQYHLAEEPSDRSPSEHKIDWTTRGGSETLTG